MGLGGFGKSASSGIYVEAAGAKTANGTLLRLTMLLKGSESRQPMEPSSSAFERNYNPSAYHATDKVLILL